MFDREMNCSKFVLRRSIDRLNYFDTEESYAIFTLLEEEKSWKLKDN